MSTTLQLHKLNVSSYNLLALMAAVANTTGLPLAAVNVTLVSAFVQANINFAGVALLSKRAQTALQRQLTTSLQQATSMRSAPAVALYSSMSRRRLATVDLATVVPVTITLTAAQSASLGDVQAALNTSAVLGAAAQSAGALRASLPSAPFANVILNVTIVTVAGSAAQSVMSNNVAWTHALNASLGASGLSFGYITISPSVVAYTSPPPGPLTDGQKVAALLRKWSLGVGIGVGGFLVLACVGVIVLVRRARAARAPPPVMMDIKEVEEEEVEEEKPVAVPISENDPVVLCLVETRTRALLAEADARARAKIAMAEAAALEAKARAAEATRRLQRAEDASAELDRRARKAEAAAEDFANRLSTQDAASAAQRPPWMANAE
jgi:hypothetical protein